MFPTAVLLVCSDVHFHGCCVHHPSSAVHAAADGPASHDDCEAAAEDCAPAFRCCAGGTSVVCVGYSESNASGAAFGTKFAADFGGGALQGAEVVLRPELGAAGRPRGAGAGPGAWFNRVEAVWLSMRLCSTSCGGGGFAKAVPGSLTSSGLAEQMRDADVIGSPNGSCFDTSNTFVI